MNVWIVETGEPLPSDAGARTMRCGILSAMLAEAGHRVTWWAGTFDHVRKKHRFVGPKTIEAGKGVTLCLRLLHGPGYRRNFSPKRIYHNRVVASAFGREVLQQKPPDLVFSCMPTPELAEQAVRFGSHVGIPVVVDIRDLWPDAYLAFLPKAMLSAARILLRNEFSRMRWICSNANALTAVSNSFLQWALGYAGRKPEAVDGVFPLGYPTPNLESRKIDEATKRLVSSFTIRREALIIAFVGIFGASYDLDTVIGAARKLNHRHAEVPIQFVIAGTGDMEAKLRSAARGLDNVLFPGWLDDQSIIALLRLSSIGLAPYRAGAPQSMPNKPYEYMSAGLPILSSLRGELADLLRNESIGIQYSAADVDSLVEGILLLSGDAERRRRMGLRARRVFDERFSEQVVYKRLVRHLELIGAAPRDSACERASLDSGLRRHLVQ